MGREARVVQKPSEAYERAVNRVAVPHGEANGVALAGQLRANGLQPRAQIIAALIAFKGKVEVFGVAREREEEAQAGAALES
jgi:hypothetical protein